MDREEFGSMCATAPPIHCSICNQEIENDDDAVSEAHYYDIGAEVFGSTSEYIPEDFSHFTYRHRKCLEERWRT